MAVMAQVRSASESKDGFLPLALVCKGGTLYGSRAVSQWLDQA